MKGNIVSPVWLTKLSKNVQIWLIRQRLQEIIQGWQLHSEQSEGWFKRAMFSRHQLPPQRSKIMRRINCPSESLSKILIVPRISFIKWIAGCRSPRCRFFPFVLRVRAWGSRLRRELKLSAGCLFCSRVRATRCTRREWNACSTSSSSDTHWNPGNVCRSYIY